MLGGRLPYLRDEGGIATIIVVAIALIAGLFFFSAAAAINWQFILAVMAMGIIGISFIGVIFFRANFKLVIMAALVSLAIVFIVEVSFPVIVGGLIALGAVWHLKLLSKRPLILVSLVAAGLLVMLLGYHFVMIPLGVYP